MSSPSKLRVGVEVEGVSEAEDMMALLGRRAYDTFVLMGEMVEYLAEVSRERVEREPWTPLKDVTVARKESQAENTDILRDEWRSIKGTPTRQGDALYRALTQDGAPGQLRRSTRTFATFGVKSAGKGPLFYARFVQNVKGTKRRILAISAEQALTISERVARYIVEGGLQSQKNFLTARAGYNRGFSTRYS